MPISWKQLLGDCRKLANVKIVCREGYKTAGGFLAHVGEVKEDLEALIKQVGKQRVLVWRELLGGRGENSSLIFRL